MLRTLKATSILFVISVSNPFGDCCCYSYSYSFSVAFASTTITPAKHYTANTVNNNTYDLFSDKNHFLVFIECM